MTHPSWKVAGLVIVLAAFAARDLGAFSLLERIYNLDIQQVISAPPVTHDRVNSVRITYSENSLINAKCTAAITTDDQRTIEVTTDPPPAIQKDQLQSNPYVPYRDVLCDALQAASAEGW